VRAMRTFQQGQDVAQAQPPTVAGATELYCPDCKNLHRILELASTKYAMACSAPFHRVCTESAARAQVDMERAKNDLQEHQSVCAGSCDRSKLNEHEAALVTTAEHQRNFRACLGGYEECEHSQLTPSEAKAISAERASRSR
jgi:hypothetical protein